MSLHRQAVSAFASLLALSLLVLFWGLGGGRLNIYDEGLYGMYGRTLLHYGVVLHAVDVHGDFPTGAVKFSKPPLSIWAVAASMRWLGPSLFALRLPFALSSLAVTLLLFGFGRLIEPGARGVWLGFGWGLSWLISFGTYEHGRTATIEAMLLAFLVAALYAHARALAPDDRAPEQPARARPLWAALAGLAIGAAFFTKQLVCALAVVPILVAEYRHRGDRPRAPQLVRLSLAFGVPAGLALGWFGALYAKVGFAAFRVLWNHAIVRRVSGFDGVHHQNYLNRVAELLDIDAAPFAWQIGLLGLGLIWLVRGRKSQRSAADSVWLVGVWFACSWLAFDVGSRAILPWYALTLLPPLALGHAWLALNALEYAYRRAVPDAAASARAEPSASSESPRDLQFCSQPDPSRTSPLSALIVAGGAFALALSAGLAARAFMPSLLALALALAAIVYTLQTPPPSAAKLRWLLGGFALLLAIGTVAREGYRGSDTDPLSALGQALYARGLTRVSVDSRANVHPYALTTFFGADAELAAAPPWQLEPEEAKHFQARVELVSWPLEVEPRAGVQLLREAGILAWIGDLTRAPVSGDELKHALAAGPLTFEAEQMASERFYTLASDPSASNQRVRLAVQRPLERAEDFSLAKARTPELPHGRYIASFWLKLRCTGYRGETLGEARVASRRMATKRKYLDCRDTDAQDPDRFNSLDVSFSLTSAAPVELELRSSQGEVALDRVRVRRE